MLNEKPTCSNLTLQKTSAMEQNTMVGILSNEVMRRMLNIGGGTSLKARLDALDNYAVKLLTSGFSLEQTRRIILSGVRGYEGKVRRRELEMTPLYRTSEESGSSRARKKILGKSTWFKGGKEGKKKTVLNGRNKGLKWEHRNSDTGPLDTKTVLFVEHTPEGTLAKMLREQLGRMEGTMGFRIKVVERAGTRLKDMFSLPTYGGEFSVNVETARRVLKKGKTCQTARRGE